MEAIQTKLKVNLAASIVLSVAIGVACNYLYDVARGIFAPLVISVAGALIDPYSEQLWLYTGALNIGYSVCCGLLVSCLGIAAIHFLMRPTNVFLYLVAAIPYIVLSYWWFITDIRGFTQVAPPEHVWVTLLSPLAAILVWISSSVWWANRYAPNK
jgi:hypothetical protein